MKMSQKNCLLLLLVVAVVVSSLAIDGISIQPIGWGPVQCRLVTNHSTWEEQEPAEVDFWMTGQWSGQRYGCHFDPSDERRKSILAESWRFGTRQPSTWIEELSKRYLQSRKQRSSKVVANSQPAFVCSPPSEEGPGSTLLTTMFPVRTCRNISGFEPEWQGCKFRKTKQDSFDWAVFTVLFRGGSPTIVCGFGTPDKYTVDSVSLPGIVSPKFNCFFVTYLDFPGITYPPERQVFKETVEKKWRATDITRTFPPYSCWSSTEDINKMWDFEVLGKAEFSRRCRFHGGCPECTTEGFHNQLTCEATDNSLNLV